MISLREIKDIPTLIRWRAEVIEHVFGDKADETPSVGDVEKSILKQQRMVARSINLSASATFLT